MSTFTDPLIVEVVGPNKFKIREEFRYHIGEYPAKNTKDIITVMVGYVTDMASVPRIFWPILAPVDSYAKAAVIHDWLYRRGFFTRKKTDKIFLEAMKVLNVPKWKYFLLYNSVKYFGMFRWNYCRRNYGRSLLWKRD